MALRDKSTVEATEQFVAGEDQISDQAFVEQDVAQAAAPAAAPAVAPQANTSLAANAGLPQTCILQQMKDVFARMGKEWSWTTYTGVNVAGGAVKTAQKASLGNFIDVRVLNWEDQYMVHCGVAQPTDETKELVRYSKDGKTLEKGGGSVDSWIQQLKEEGYPNARCDKRVVILGVLMGSDRKVEGVKYVCVSLSPSSRNNWLAFLEGRDLDIQFGGKVDDPMKQVVRMSVESVTNKQKQDYSVFAFTHQDDLQ